MIQSMTGYAALTRDVGIGALQFELKGVNSRFLDLHFKIHEDFRGQEAALRELISATVARGKVECRLYLNIGAPREASRDIQQAALERLLVLQADVRAHFPEAKCLSVGEVLRWPGLFGEESLDPATLAPVVLEMARVALADFKASRVREGGKLAVVVLERVARMREIVATVAPRIPEAQAIFAEKLRQRLLEVLSSADEERIRQEVAVFANRIDVAEELARLVTHLDEVERVLKQGGAVGKRLDFLTQELNREANTLGSKSAVTEVSQASMELKLLIEQIKEQIQNLE